jgi:hypothetical protein
VLPCHLQDPHPPLPETISPLLEDFLLKCFQKVRWGSVNAWAGGSKPVRHAETDMLYVLGCSVSCILLGAVHACPYAVGSHGDHHKQALWRVQQARH